MKGTLAFIFFMLFLAGIAFVNLRGMQDGVAVTSAEQVLDVGWRPTHIGEMDVDEETKMTLQFESNGRIGGHGGCNRFFGSYVIEESGLSVSMVGSTRMACPGSDESMEIAYLEILGETRSAARLDERLALKNADGATIARFVAIPRESF